MDSKLKKQALHRAKILEGQMKGLAKAIDEEKYCIDLLTQSLSIKRSLASLGGFLLENHIRTHVKHQLAKPGEEAKAVKELISIFSLSNR